MPDRSTRELWAGKSKRAYELPEVDAMKKSNPARKNRLLRFQMAWLLVTFFLPLHAQEAPQSTLPASPQTNTTSVVSGNKQNQKAGDEVPKRIFWIIPNFMTTNDQPQNRGPLTTREKYSIAWHQFADPGAHVGNLIQASISQAANGIPHYGQGWGAFGQRFAAQEADQFTSSFLIYGVFPQLLHQDPRYFRKGAGSAISRVGYAASRVFVARRDNGHSVFNASQVFGQLGQAGISMSYYPEQDRNARGLFLGWGISQAYAIGWNQLKEFTPDLNEYLRRRAQRKHNHQMQH